jgi:uncharacterized protein
MAQAPQNGLPADIQNVIRRQYVSAEADTRYLDGSVDLNADGKLEILVHIVGGAACGTGGCPTLVFTPDGSGYRLVSTISVTKPPIRVSTARAAGWRNLIVHVSGGGAKSSDVELTFNGESYPENPTVLGPRVKRTTSAGSQIVIKDFSSFEDAKPLPKASGGGASAVLATKATASGSGPSFDCAKVSAPVEKLVCGDAELAGLDRTLSTAYTKAMVQWPESDKGKERAAQRTWITTRNACAEQQDIKSCVRSSYRRRLIEVQIRGGQLEVPPAVGYVCKGHENEPFQVTFYNQTEPQSAVITFDDRQTIAFASPTGSGARYTGTNVDFWEHHGEATVKWSGTTYTCNAR